MPIGIGGEIGWWCPSLDNTNNGTLILSDFSGNQNHGTLTSMDPATDWVEDAANGGVRALDFDGVNDFCNLGNSSLFTFGTGNFSIAGWIWTATGTTSGIWLGKDTDTARQWSCWVGIAENATFPAGYVTFFNNTGQQQPGFGTEAASFTFDQWNHICHVRSGQNGSTFINGNLIRTKSLTGFVVNYSLVSNVYLGGRQFPGFLNPLRMRADDVRIFNRALTQNEITALASKRGYQPPSNTRRRRYSGSYGL